MGHHCSWIATRGLALGEALGRLGLVRTGQSDEPVCDPGLYAVVLPRDWLVVVADGEDYTSYLRDEHAVELSRHAETLFFLTDDTSMGTYLGAFARGTCTWELSYDGAHGVAAPTIIGAPPAPVWTQLAAARRRQADAGGVDASVDCMYDVAADAGRDLIGFRHDVSLADGDVLPIQRLAPRR